MAEVFQCDYCGRYWPLSQAIDAWAMSYETSDGDTVYTVAITCSLSCAQRVNEIRVAR